MFQLFVVAFAFKEFWKSKFEFWPALSHH